MMRESKKRIAKLRTGFTLIELLVVIAIIALLLSIIMPALNKAKAMAKDLICRTNLKSMSLATILYVEDSNGKMMAYSPSTGLWVNQISGYLDNMDEARYCPMTKIVEPPATTPGLEWGSSTKAWMWGWGTPEYEYGSYGINGHFYGAKVSNFQMPFLTPIFADSIWIDGWPMDTDHCPADFDLNGSPNYIGKMSMHVINRHGSHINVGFIDGHQEPVKLSALWSLKWHNDFVRVDETTRDDGTPIYQK